MGACDQKTTEGILDYFYEQGGNFIDTANNYQFGESEMWIGEWMKKRGNRDEMGKYPAQGRGPLQVDDDNVSSDALHLVIATKYTTNFMGGPPGEGRIVSAATILPGR